MVYYKYIYIYTHITIYLHNDNDNNNNNHNNDTNDISSDRSIDMWRSSRRPRKTEPVRGSLRRRKRSHWSNYTMIYYTSVLYSTILS